MQPCWRRCRNVALAVVLLSSVLFAERVKFTILQINDLYEITPVAGGKVGGLARLATVKKDLLKENQQTFMFLAGDVFSPSALGTAKIGGKAIAGEQMIAVLNKVGLDYSTFGNHEFDLNEEQFKARLKQSTAVWFSGNVRDAAGQPFDGVKDHVVFTVRGQSGAIVKVGAIAVTLPVTVKPYVTYKDTLQTAKAEAKALRPQVDVLIALTHQAIADDITLAKEVPELDLIMGGHEHENIQVWRGPDLTPITKADANVRTAYIHRLMYDTATRKVVDETQLQQIDSSIPEDAETAKLVNAWVQKAFDAFRSNGFDPEQVVTVTKVVLDGKEKDVRNGQTNLTEVIARGMLAAVPDADASVFNSGSIRIDDDLPAGPITQYDIIRVLPFGGKIVSVDLKGALLEKVLEAGWNNRGSGGWLQWANITRTPGTPTEWLVKGKPIDPAKIYKIATTDFLMTGGEQNIGFLRRDNPDVRGTKDYQDIRFAVIGELQKESK